MRVICINSDVINKKLPALKEGAMYTVIRMSVAFPNNYVLDEIPIQPDGRQPTYHHRYFIPCSEIDELQLSSVNELVNNQ